MQAETLDAARELNGVEGILRGEAGDDADVCGLKRQGGIVVSCIQLSIAGPRRPESSREGEMLCNRHRWSHILP